MVETLWATLFVLRNFMRLEYNVVVFSRWKISLLGRVQKMKLIAIGSRSERTWPLTVHYDIYNSNKNQDYLSVLTFSTDYWLTMGQRHLRYRDVYKSVTCPSVT